MEVLNKSAVVLLVACWEAYIEDLATTAFEYMLTQVTDANAIPARVLVSAVEGLKNSQDARAVWALAGDGWRAVLQAHKADVLLDHVKGLNTPRHKQIDSMFDSLLGLRWLSNGWRWQGMTVARSRDKLDGLVTLRGDIAHRVAASTSVLKRDVIDYAEFIWRLATTSSNSVRAHLIQFTPGEPWAAYSM